MRPHVSEDRIRITRSAEEARLTAVGRNEADRTVKWDGRADSEFTDTSP